MKSQHVWLSLGQYRSFPSSKISTCPASSFHGGFWACIISRDPSGVSKPNQSRVVIFRLSFINFKFIPLSPLKGSAILLKVLNFKRIFLKLNQFICNYMNMLIISVHCPHAWEGSVVFSHLAAVDKKITNPPCIIDCKKVHLPNLFLEQNNATNKILHEKKNVYRSQCFI